MEIAKKSEPHDIPIQYGVVGFVAYDMYIHCCHLSFTESSKTVTPTETEKAVLMQHDMVAKYQQLLAESEQKLTEK
ncbi:hypothetical protein NQ315_005765 [Exocentrus adspersus]|uniref:Uncharacterized protein n=1 Tax=Exocentrus adspersus TaxID=1586481 RepID=A0AAV8V838_9CUCU|nr:hypothetical protein NQ315_005765 [Exocentrus adspersus]